MTTRSYEMNVAPKRLSFGWATVWDGNHGANKKDIVRKHVNPSSINNKVSKVVKLPLFRMVNHSYLIEWNVVLLRVSIHGPHSACRT